MMDNKEMLFGLMIWFIIMLVIVSLVSPKYEKLCNDKCGVIIKNESNTDKNFKKTNYKGQRNSIFYDISWYSNDTTIFFLN